MSTKTICVGDKVQSVTMSDGTFGKAPEMVRGCVLECRIDINSAGESSETAIADRKRSGMAFFSENPKLRVGHYLRWISTNCGRSNPATTFRVVGEYFEGPPGADPWLWIVELEESAQVTEMVASQAQ